YEPTPLLQRDIKAGVLPFSRYGVVGVPSIAEQRAGGWGRLFGAGPDCHATHIEPEEDAAIAMVFSGLGAVGLVIPGRVAVLKIRVGAIRAFAIPGLLSRRIDLEYIPTGKRYRGGGIVGYLDPCFGTFGTGADCHAAGVHPQEAAVIQAIEDWLLAVDGIKPYRCRAVRPGNSVPIAALPIPTLDLTGIA